MSAADFPVALILKERIFMVTIKNNRMEISIANRGAEIKRVTVDGKDVFWNGDPAFWDGTAPVLFPMCGGLRDDKYTLDGHEYNLPKHGFAKDMDFAVEKRGNNFVTFLLTDTDETLSCYPWHFEFRITYSLRATVLEVRYDVKNLSDNRMYFSLGSHEAYACPEGIEDYDIIFDKKETLETCEVVGSLIGNGVKTVLKDSDTLPLYNEYFEIDALVFKNHKSRAVTLRNRKTGRSVCVEFPDAKYLLIWTKPNAKFVCIEPWTGIPPMLEDSYAIEEKEGITALEPNGNYTNTHTIYF